MTRQYFSDQKDLHSEADDLNILSHPKSAERERRNRTENYRTGLLEKSTHIFSNNRKLITYAGSILALGLLIGSASAVAYRLRKRKSLFNRWLNGKF